MSPLQIGIMLVIMAFYLYCSWRIFEKAGKPGWACIIPIYNLIVLYKIIGKPWWWLLLLFIPIVNLVISIMVANQLSVRFGKGVGFTLGLLFLPFIFIPVLGLGSAKYSPPSLPAKA
jgi:hypothetical protein